MMTYPELLNAIQALDEDAYLLVGLLFEQDRGRDVRDLLSAMGAQEWIDRPLVGEERRLLIGALHSQLALERPPLGAICALHATADPETMRPLTALQARIVDDPAQQVLAHQVLTALLSIPWPEAHRSAKLAFERGLDAAKEDAGTWLALHDSPGR